VGSHHGGESEVTSASGMGDRFSSLMVIGEPRHRSTPKCAIVGTMRITANIRPGSCRWCASGAWASTAAAEKTLRISAFSDVLQPSSPVPHPSLDDVTASRPPVKSARHSESDDQWPSKRPP